MLSSTSSSRRGEARAFSRERPLWNVLFLGLLTIVLMIGPFYWLSRGGQWETVSIVENRKLQVFSPFPFQDLKTAVKRLLQRKPREAYTLVEPLLTGFYQRQVQAAISDQFPFRKPLIAGSKAAERVVIESAFLPMPDPAIPAAMNSDILVMRDGSNLLYRPILFDETVRMNIDTRIRDYTLLINSYPQVNFYLFYIDRIRNSPYHPMAAWYPKADREQALQYFEAHKPEGLTMAKLMIEDFATYQTNFFRTDHHWNIHGAWAGYEGVYNMIAPNYPNISPMLKLKGFKAIPGVEFLGSQARDSLYPFAPEAFEYPLVDIPAYKTYVNGQKKAYEYRADYMAGKFSHQQYYNHYRRYFGGDDALVQYHFSNPSGRNLLTIGSSFSQGADLYIASHYQNTYVIDLRNFKHFSLGTLIKKYRIDDVLVLDDSRAIDDLDWTINP